MRSSWVGRSFCHSCKRGGASIRGDELITLLFRAKSERKYRIPGSVSERAMLYFLNFETNFSKWDGIPAKPAKYRELPFRQFQLSERFQARLEFALNFSRLLVVPSANLICLCRAPVTSKLPPDRHLISHFCYGYSSAVDAVSQF